MNIHEKLNIIQSRLKAPKGQYNNFGKYNYRNCEDILEAVKPLLNETKTTLIVQDDIIYIEGRFYVKATATLYDCESEQSISTSAFARESTEKKGMDEAQITGATSSYARKYSLNGLFSIDDTKDMDSLENPNNNQKNKNNVRENNRVVQNSMFGVIDKVKVQRLIALAENKGINEVQLKEKLKKDIEHLTNDEYEKTMRWLNAK